MQNNGELNKFFLVIIPISFCHKLHNIRPPCHTSINNFILSMLRIFKVEELTCLHTFSCDLHLPLSNMSRKAIKLQNKQLFFLMFKLGTHFTPHNMNQPIIFNNKLCPCIFPINLEIFNVHHIGLVFYFYFGH